ncbi:MAG: D-alanyl-D-alanine carboxypeptidase family protein [Acidimicrobiia bacterium]
MRRHRSRTALGRRLVVAVLAAVLSLHPVASGAQQSDTEKTRDEVRERQAQVDTQVDALTAEDVEVREELAALSASVDTQRATLEEAERAAAEAADEVVAADRAVAAAERRIERLDHEADELVADSYMNPSAGSPLEALDAESVSDAAVKSALIELAAESDADVLDQLEAAREDLEAEKAAREERAAAAEEKRAAAADALDDLEEALAEQEAFALEVEQRLERKLAEAESLKAIDEALSERIAREQEELARALRALREAQERREAEARRAAEAADAQRAAEEAAAESADEQPAPASDPAPAPDPTPELPPVTIRPAPGGLATVTCADGGEITVAGSIADNLSSMISDAAEDGVMLCGSGYRDPQRQVELRRQHCGTSDYAVYQMPSSSCSPPTARPGSSLHERGLAIDFTCNGASMGGSICFDWLAANASRYGFYNLPSEPWHWSTTGG